MSQIIACKNQNGIVLAADGKGFNVSPAGELVEGSTARLFQLGPTSAILAGGTMEAEKMCRTLKVFVAEESLKDVEEIYGAALPFLASEYDRFMRKHCEVMPSDPIHQVYFILAGLSTTNSDDPYRIYLIWTKKKLPQLDGDEITTAFTVPRIMRLEYRLSRLCRENAPLETVLDEVKSHMENLATTQDEIGGPFSFASITRDGFKRS
jgi:hypothetical protein